MINDQVKNVHNWFEEHINKSIDQIVVEKITDDNANEIPCHLRRIEEVGVGLIELSAADNSYGGCVIVGMRHALFLIDMFVRACQSGLVSSPSFSEFFSKCDDAGNIEMRNLTLMGEIVPSVVSMSIALGYPLASAETDHGQFVIFGRGLFDEVAKTTLIYLSELKSKRTIN